MQQCHRDKATLESHQQEERRNNKKEFQKKKRYSKKPKRQQCPYKYKRNKNNRWMSPPFLTVSLKEDHKTF